MFIQPEQIRAARAMLNWSQQDLAEAAGVSKDTVKNYELGNNQPNTKTLTTIEAALMTAGIEFSADGGIRPMKQQIQFLNGRSGIRTLADIIYKSCLNDPSAPVIAANVRQTAFSFWLDDYAPYHRQRLGEIKNLSNIRIITTDQDKHGAEISFPFVSYRALDDQFFGDVGMYCFGEYVALLDIDIKKCNITLIKNRLLNITLLKLLEIAWLTSRELK